MLGAQPLATTGRRSTHDRRRHREVEHEREQVLHDGGRGARSRGQRDGRENQSDGTPEDDNNTDADETDAVGGGSYASGVVSATLPVVNPAATLTARFRVTVN